MFVDSLMPDDGPTIYYDPDFRVVLEDHMTFLRTHPKTTVLDIDPAKAYQYEYDLASLLYFYNVPNYFHWLVMRMNNMTSPTEATRDISALLQPNMTVVEQIRQSHVTARRVN